MKILCDVHITYKVVKLLIDKGIEAVHINQILDKWFTKDHEISYYADLHDYTVVSKDADFKDSHLLRNTPKKLIKINLGNISNKELLVIFDAHWQSFEKITEQGKCLIEVNADSITVLL